MTNGPIFKNHKTNFHPSELHKKIGQIAFIEPGDGDINEGNFIAQLVFMDDKMNLYVLKEWDYREERP